ncbi:MAG TPA: BTAD domain-containing putative transcriptional regulator [Solirubrobacter sp.]|nr:BTAD domain-containing putative transcriptional regulator [Solirubrobacter sp.]
MRISVLGPLEVERDGCPLAVGGGRLRALLACLALEAGKPVSTGRLVDALWEDELPADQVHALQSLVSRLRRALGDGALVAPAPGGYRLDVDPDAVDALRFERLVEDRALDDALALWRGPALADVLDYRFAQAAAARLDDLRVTAQADRIDVELARGHGDRLVAELEALAAAHPLHERIAAQLIRSLYAAGRQADALAAYERVRTLLSEEMGVPPSPELQQAHMAVLNAETTTPGGRSNLPAPVTSFVGREREIAQIGELLERGRLVTLLGPGGAGKTRLARESTARRVDEVADGVWLVELAPVTAEVEIVPAVLGALGLREAVLGDRATLGVRDGLERLLDVLAAREAILVLDNCEHLIAPVAELVDRLLRACPRLRIVATSREALAIDGESLVAVAPLAPDPAVELFADRASAAREGFVVDAAAREICRRLDGLPLALELAAARLRTMTASELAERLDDRFRLLTGGSRTALPRHRTLRAVVDWSWDLLDEHERTLARRLAVFSAGATVESASAVLGEDALDGLAALAERSLLQVVPGSRPTRYRMLETIREYGLEKLHEAGELQATRDAHAAYFAGLVARAEPQLRRADQRRWFELLQDERENVIAALRHLGDAGDARRAVKLAVDLLWYWLLSGSQEEALAWLTFALAVPGEADPDDRAIAESVRALDGFDEIADEAEVRAAFAEIDARILRIDDGARPLVALAKVVLAIFAEEPEREAEARRCALAHPDPWVRAGVHLLLAGTAENQGDVETMGVELAHAHGDFEALGDGWGVAMAQFIDSGRLQVAGDLERAETALERARAALEQLSPETAAGMLDLRVAEIRLRRGDLAGAREFADRARSRRDLGTDETAFALATLARIDWLSGDVESARRELADARERLDRRGPIMPRQRHGEAVVEGLRAAIAAEDGDLETADRLLAGAYDAALGTTDMPVIAAVAVAGACVAARRGDSETAAALLSAAAAVRGAEDPTNPEILRLGIAAAPPVSREAALAYLSERLSRPAPVSP